MQLRRKKKFATRFLCSSLALLALGACSGGDAQVSPTQGTTGPTSCNGFCQDTPTRLTQGDVAKVIAQAVAEARARNVFATIAVVDRVGNVLAVFEMDDPATSGVNRITITSGEPTDGGLDGVQIVPASLGAIAKALTATYFSSEGNAFSTRTAGQIIQEHFNPGEFNTPGGPLFGVQISQLPCSDISRRRVTAGPDPGPHRSPIGFAADPGGLPLFKNGTPVGAVGVIADGTYGVDRIITDNDTDIDELIATAGTFGLAAPRDRRADVITVEGKSLRFSEVDFADLATQPANAPAFGTIPPAVGVLQAVRGYTDYDVLEIKAGKAFGQPESGIRAAGAGEPELVPLDAFVLVDETNTRRFAPRTSDDGGFLLGEVRDVIARSIALANRTRSQVRRPLGSRAGIHVSVVGTNGEVLGVARTRDALVDATDVTVQKARTALFFSQAGAAAALNGVPPAEYIRPVPPAAASPLPATPALRTEPIGQYVTAYRSFLGLPAGLSDGGIAWSTRAFGNIVKPNYPENVDGNPPGPLSKPAGEWSIFSTGLELDLVYNAVIRHLAFVLGLAATDVDQNCTGYAGVSGSGGAFAPFEVSGRFPQLANGLTLFAGGFPIYRGNTLIGAIGLSGDGLEQDDFLPFLAVDQVGREYGTFNNAPTGLRADRLAPGGINLRWVICPQSPFLDSTEQSVCNGL
ncbi:MAG TPA: heme-binding protein [Solimonas sp.]|nr:heme-binding protein [Solimonas sp.]